MPTMLRPPPLVLLDVDEHGVVVLRALAPHFAQPNTTANRISTRPSRRCCADSSVLSSLLMSKKDSKSHPNSLNLTKIKSVISRFLTVVRHLWEKKARGIRFQKSGELFG